ncbi:hypothetical protein J6590_034795 [Homalodisca vitripennis]|nr:hypothetical protein J6590_034795 [Homalodisca vitripennis]
MCGSGASVLQPLVYAQTILVCVEEVDSGCVVVERLCRGRVFTLRLYLVRVEEVDSGCVVVERLCRGRVFTLRLYLVRVEEVDSGCMVVERLCRGRVFTLRLYLVCAEDGNPQVQNAEDPKTISGTDTFVNSFDRETGRRCIAAPRHNQPISYYPARVPT